MSIDCHIIFNEPTDREDWLARCVASLENPAVSVHVHRFAESESIFVRRRDLVAAHDPSRWIMFADPDDYALRPAYDRYIELLLTTDKDAAWTFETVLLRDGRKYVTKGPHHLVALREDKVMVCDVRKEYYSEMGSDFAYFPEPAYCWVRHPGATGGVDRG